MEKIGILYDPIFMLHNPGPDHPESAVRLEAVMEAIDSSRVERIAIKAVPASQEELLLVHDKQYVDYILALEIRDSMQLDLDTAISEHSKEAALKAAGGVIESVRWILDERIKRAFCAVRPPGHHAESDRSMGFCIFNNVALGAAYAISQGVDRVAVIDWDLHHGNGTQNAFYISDKVLYISTHQAPYYPGTGYENERGSGAGIGYNFNIPMPSGSSDADFRGAFDEIIIPELRNFIPEIIFISAGFDAHRDDPLGGLRLTTEFFGEMTRMLVDVANDHSNGRMISVLEGGYSPKALKECVALHIKELSN